MVEGHDTYSDRGEAAFMEVLRQYKRNAINRKLDFAITDLQFFLLTQKNCFFCGRHPGNLRSARERVYVGNGAFKHNGVDRWNSDLGYTATNCVPCCKICNYAKRSLSGEEFIEWICNIAEYVRVSKNNWIERKRAVEEYLLQPDNSA
jgi:hypothetical protein